MSDEFYKAAKLEANGDVKSKGKVPMAEEDVEDDSEAGPELPPDFDAEDIPDDEEGRFFGGGMERKTAQAMQYIDQQDEGEAAVWKDLRQQCQSGPSSNVALARENRFCLVATAGPHL
jgi:beta-catenin-like protein 1